ncbi:glycosyltransferase [Streptomyces fractus]|uniref:glycosyltransferase n=1 Tax=Streptomyces fractus TaxID=641806 RepID=UPI003CF94687
MNSRTHGVSPEADERVLVVHDFLGHPFPVGLSHELARRGRRVTHLYSGDHVGPHGPLEERPADGATVRAVRGGERAPYGAAARDACLTAVREWRESGARGPVTLLSANAAPHVQAELLAVARERGWRYVYWLQDLYGAAPTVDPGTAAREAAAVRASDHVVAVTEGFARSARALGVPEDRVTVIPNWAAPPGARAPDAPVWEPAARFLARGEPILLYAGTLDERHAPELLVELADACARARLGQVVVVSQGGGRAWLERQRRLRGLTRLTLLDLQPYEDVPAMLAAADVTLVTLAREAAAVSAPSKLLACLAAGRCVLAAAPDGTETARVVLASGGGLVTDPRDAAGFTAAALRLSRDPALRASYARSARVWSRDAFDVPAVADRFARVLWGRPAEDAP